MRRFKYHHLKRHSAKDNSSMNFAVRRVNLRTVLFFGSLLHKSNSLKIDNVLIGFIRFNEDKVDIMFAGG